MSVDFDEMMDVSSEALEGLEHQRRSNDENPELIFDENKGFKRVRCNFGVFAFGKVAIGFVHSYICSDDAQVITSVKVIPPAFLEPLQDSGLTHTRRPREFARVLLSSKNSKTLVCEIEEEFPEKLCGKLCEYICRFCNLTAKVVVLMVQHLSSFETEQSSRNDMEIRCVATTEYLRRDSNVGCPYLTLPNVLGNFPAVILINSEEENKKTILYVCFCETNHVATENNEVFEVFLRLPVFQTVGMNPNAKARFKAFLNKASLSNSDQFS